MDKNTGFLLNEGYRLAALHDPKKTNTCAPDSIVLTDESGARVEYCVTSTRLALIGRELPGGKLGDAYGIVCAKDTRGDYEYTLAGGRMEPFKKDYRTDTDLPAEETVRMCLWREVEEELGLDIKKDDPILVGVRTITENRSDQVKMIDGKPCVDAYFAHFIDERLGESTGFNGETGDRTVLSPEDLFQNTPHGNLRPLPQTQRLALAIAIIAIRDIFGDQGLPEAIAALIKRSYPLAIDVRSISPWAKNLIPVIQH